mgnify:CR=1 FL=1
MPNETEEPPGSACPPRPTGDRRRSVGACVARPLARCLGRVAAAVFALAVLPFAVAHPASAIDEVVDLELVLAVDVSWSMDLDEQVLQRDGYVAAFRHPDVIAAIQSGDWGRIAVTYVEWAGVGLQHTRVPWTIVDGPETATAFAALLAEAPLGRLRRTSISSALDRTGELFEGNGIEGMRRVVDVSGDGPNNMGGPVTAARDRLIEAGIVVNGLPIMLKRPGAGGYFQIPDLDIYYEDCVIGGFGSFVIPVRARSEFADAIRRKLVLEIAAAPPPDPPVIRAQYGTVRSRIDCLIGERMWQQWQDGRW